jgi:FKBP-type peptidyl-prolyl cis-trans isomerase
VIGMYILLASYASTLIAALHFETPKVTRRNFLSQAGLWSGVTLSLLDSPASLAVMMDSTDISSDGVTVFKLKSGLQFIDLVEGTGSSPRYGQFCSIKYTAYLKLPKDGILQKFDSAEFLHKHGNGRIISGLDEGLHTMMVGSQRRIIIPPKLGFVDDALGPVPQSPFDRRKLNNLLKQMVEQRGGQLIYDVELLRVLDDEADQGYYDDMSLTDEQFNSLRENIQNKAII